MGVRGQPHAAAVLPSGKNNLTHSIRGRLGPRANLNVLEEAGIFYPPGIRTPARPAGILDAILTTLSI